MTTVTPYGTAEDFRDFTAETFFSDEYRFSKTCAILSGWKPGVYKQLFVKYITSTQEIIGNQSAVKTKGDPFEDIVRYFLKQGGLARSITSIKDSGKWELDGHGILNRENLESVWGRHDASYAGNSLILECKNKTSAVGADEFSKYQSRMTKFNCQLGVFASTSGFAIDKGLGIADEIHLDFRTNKYNLLLSIEDLYIVYSEKIPPLQLLTISLNNARFNKYTIDKELQKRMSADHCNKLAQQYYNMILEEASTL